MKREVFFGFFLLTATILAFGDDAIVAGTGDTLHPVGSSSIRMNDERLQISYGSNIWKVQVAYDFINDSEDRTEQMAFVSRNNTSKFNDNSINGDFLYFSTTVNGDTIAASKKTTSDGTDYFQYTMSFKKGHNSVVHEYGLKGTDFSISRVLDYTLTTGGNWANGIIGHILIRVTFDSPTFLIDFNHFFTPYGLFKKGESYGTQFSLMKSILGGPDKYLFISKGGLSFEASNYRPTSDIEIEVRPTGLALQKELIIPEHGIDLNMLIQGDLKTNSEAISKLTKEQLGLLRNAIYAWHGYDFKNPSLRDFFGKYGWYIPSEKTNIELSNIEEENLAIIRRYES